MFQVWKTVKNPLAGRKSYEEYLAIIEQGILDLDSKQKLDFGGRELLKERVFGAGVGVCRLGNSELKLVLITPRELGLTSQEPMNIEGVSVVAVNLGLKRCEPAVAILLALQGGTSFEEAIILGDETYWAKTHPGVYGSMQYVSMWITGDKLSGRSGYITADTQMVYAKA